MKMSKFTIFLARNGQFYWRLKASNGETLCHSEGYTAKQSAQRGIESCKLNALTGKYTVFQGNDAQFYWNLKAVNGEILCHSEGYSTKQSAENGVEACKRNAPVARIVDETLTDA
ncbi:MAG: YegP family protein [Alphaproteobacteria bacterium]|nr:YegP family protein [Alphaproteobacteria bacterium]